jgi:hypothetical protein
VFALSMLEDEERRPYLLSLIYNDLAACSLDPGSKSASHQQQQQHVPSYPMLYPQADILRDWNPAVTSVPAHYGKYSSLRFFDFSDPEERAEAEEYRRAEVRKKL